MTPRLSSFHELGIMTKLFFVSVLIFLVVGSVLGIVFLSFNSVETFLQTLVDRDMTQLMHNEQLILDMNEILYGGYSLVVGSLFEKEKVTDVKQNELATYIVQKMKPLSRRVKHQRLKTALQDFDRLLHRLIEQCVVMHRASHALTELDAQLRATVATLEHTMKAQNLSFDQNAVKTSGPSSFDIWFLAYREKLLNVALTVAELKQEKIGLVRTTLAEEEDTQREQVQYIVTLLDDLHRMTAMLEGFTAAEPIVEDARQLRQTLSAYKATVMDFPGLLNETERRLNTFYDAGETVMQVVREVGQDIGDLAGGMHQDTLKTLSSSQLLIVLLATLVLVALVIQWVAIRWMIRPLRGLAQAARQIAAGKTDIALIEATTQDEVGTLTRAFNSMTRQLRDVLEHLEQRVEAATQELQAALGRMTAIMDNMADGLLVTDPGGQIIRLNRPLIAMFGLEGQDILGQDCADVFNTDLSMLVKTSDSPIREASMTGEVTLAEGRIGKAIATTVTEDPTASPDVQKQIGTVILVRDITQEKEVEQMKTGFTSMVSHELRTPLTSVLGFAKIIKKRFDKTILPKVEHDPERKTQRAIQQISENLNIIIAEGERLTALINDVLDIAKMEAGKISWKMEKVSIAEIVEHALSATTALFSRKGLTVVTDIEADLPEFVGDKNRLIQVMINLFSNAVKFTNEGTVTCRVKRIGYEILVNVIDTGIGISKADQAKVFEKFKQVGDTLTDKPKGTGLGLPICKEIIKHHGGMIWVESELGTGSTFSLTLPILVPPEVQAKRVCRADLLAHLRHEAGQQTVPPEVERIPTVLIVDDEPPIRELLRQELESEAYSVQEACNGQEALSLIGAGRPGVIVLDVMMPDMNGFEVTAELKNNPLTMDIPVIILSVIEESETGRHFGIDCQLSKPIDRDRLLEHIAAFVAQRTISKHVVVVDPEAARAGELAELLRNRGHQVVETHDLCDCLNAARGRRRPDLLIADAEFSKQHGLIKLLQAETGFESVYFLLLE